jgi:hypothetical protein
MVGARTIGLLLVVLVLWTGSAWGKGVYSFVDEHGVLHLTDRPNDPRYRPVSQVNRYVAKTTRSGEPGPVIYWTRDTQQGRTRESPPETVRWQPLRLQGGGQSAGQPPSEWQQQRFDGMVQAASRSTGVSSALLHSIIRAESNFDPAAVSARGAVGLMQLMPDTARSYGVTDLTDPATNISGGARFLADLLKQFNNNLELSLAAYNAGPTTVTRYGGTVPPYPETRQYVARVMRYYREYHRAL